MCSDEKTRQGFLQAALSILLWIPALIKARIKKLSAKKKAKSKKAVKSDE